MVMIEKSDRKIGSRSDAPVSAREEFDVNPA